MADADLDQTAAEIVKGALSYNGQRCTAIKLIMAHESIAEELTDKIATAVDSLQAGLPWEEGVMITPLPDGKKLTYLVELIVDALDKGARLVNPKAAEVSGNLFFPAVVAGVIPSMRLFHEEQFGQSRQLRQSLLQTQAQ